MNSEKIKERAEQADDWTDEYLLVPGEYHPDWHTVRDEKFAELIIKDCLRIGKEVQSKSVINSSEEYNSGREMGIEVFMNQMKRHFGIEK